VPIDSFALIVLFVYCCPIARFTVALAREYREYTVKL